MVYRIDEQVWRIHEIYTQQNIKFPPPRSFALRLLEEAVELALAAGASAKDIDISVGEAKDNEQRKDPGREYEEQRPESRLELAGEIADIVLLAACTALSGDCNDSMVETHAGAKVDRLIAAAKDGSLHFTKDGRFYRRRPRRAGHGEPT